jgi:simple sugar transport system substrate-binding protein
MAVLPGRKKPILDMTMVGDKNESFDDAESLPESQRNPAAYPNIKGFQGSASTDVAGTAAPLRKLVCKMKCL